MSGKDTDQDPASGADVRAFEEAKEASDPTFQNVSPSVAQDETSVAQTGTSVAQGLPSVAQGSPSVAQGAPSVAQGAPSVAQGAPSVAQGAPSVAQNGTSVAQNGTSVAQNVPNSAEPTSEESVNPEIYGSASTALESSESSENSERTESTERPERASPDIPDDFETYEFDPKQFDQSGDEGWGPDGPPSNPGDPSWDSKDNPVQNYLASLAKKYEGQIAAVQDAYRPDHLGGAELKAAADAPINWMVKGLWTQQAKILLASEPKAGKTFVVCAIAMAVATGDMMFEKIEVVSPGPVGIIAAEDDEGEIGRRFDRMCRAKGTLLSNLDVHWWSGDAIRLNRQQDTEWIRKQVEKYGIKLMIYDPLARLMDGDENSKECVSDVLNPASLMIKELGCSVCMVHHLGKDDPDRPKTAAERLRGSSDIRSWYTTGMFLSGKLDQGRVAMELEQRVRGKLPDDFPIRAVEVEEQSVYGLGTLRLVADLEQKPTGEGANEQLIQNAAKKILDLVKDKGWMGVTTSEIAVHLKLGRTLMNAALKKLIREEGEVKWEGAQDVPEGKVLILNPGGPLGPMPPPIGYAAPAPPKTNGNGKSKRPPSPPPAVASVDEDDEEEKLFGF